MAPDDTLLSAATLRDRRQIYCAEVGATNADSDDSLAEKRPDTEDKVLRRFERRVAAASP